jgi:hypothetical protein
MALEIISTVLNDHLKVEFYGRYDFRELMDHIEVITKTAIESNRDRVLVDGRKVEGHMTESEKFFAGAKIAEVFGSKMKMAAIMKLGEVTKLGEMAAVNRGARLLITESENEAVDWLFKPAGKTAP